MMSYPQNVYLCISSDSNSLIPLILIVLLNFFNLVMHMTSMVYPVDPSISIIMQRCLWASAEGHLFGFVGV